MKSITIEMAATQHAYACILAPTGGSFQGIAVPVSGRKRGQRHTTPSTDLRHRTL